MVFVVVFAGGICGGVHDVCGVVVVIFLWLLYVFFSKILLLLLLLLLNTEWFHNCELHCHC